VPYKERIYPGRITAFASTAATQRATVVAIELALLPEFVRRRNIIRRLTNVTSKNFVYWLVASHAAFRPIDPRPRPRNETNLAPVIIVRNVIIIILNRVCSFSRGGDKRLGDFRVTPAWKHLITIISERELWALPCSESYWYRHARHSQNNSPACKPNLFRG